MKTLPWIAPFGLLWVAVGCIGQTLNERNPFLTATETYGASLLLLEEEEGAGRGAEVEAPFREPMTVTLANNNPQADVQVRLAAWVNVGSVRTAEQQDELLASGYVQLSRELRIGTAFTLPAGTYVYNGPGEAGATLVFLPRASGETDAPVASTESFTLITPDAVLAFYEPPVSCDSKAFVFTDSGFPLDAESVPGGARGHMFEGATGRGDAKTLAQVDVYQCDPLRPGLFFRGSLTEEERRQARGNTYEEGEDVRFDFNPTPDANGDFAIVTIGSTAEGAGP